MKLLGKKFKRQLTFLGVLLASSITSVAFAQTYPNLPQPIQNPAGALVKDTLYVGLGSAGANWYSLALNQKNAKWTKLADFPGPVRNNPVTLALEGKIYVFGGSGKATPDSLLTALTDVYVYDPYNNSWQQVNTFAPRGFVGSGGVTFDGKIGYLFNGVNTSVFNQYFVYAAAATTDKQKKDLADLYFDRPVASYFFDKSVVSFDPKTGFFNPVDYAKDLGQAGSAVVRDGDKVYVISGEQKPGYRTNHVIVGKLEHGQLKFDNGESLNVDANAREGVAGAYGGLLNNKVYVFGGANFPGADAQYRSGQFYAHQGLTKTWSTDIYRLDQEGWSNVGKLPLPLGYGLSFDYKDQIILVGGQTVNNSPVDKVITVTLQNNNIKLD